MVDRSFLSQMLAEPFLTDIERELAQSHLDALDENARLRKIIVTMRDAIAALHDDDWEVVLKKLGEIMKLGAVG